MKTKYSPFLRFYKCPNCDSVGERASLRDATGPCPDCGNDNLSFMIARWKIETVELSLLGDLLCMLGIIEIPRDVYTIQYPD